jgi:hypothetical protein
MTIEQATVGHALRASSAPAAGAVVDSTLVSGWGRRWTGWASWPLSVPVLVVALVAALVDVASAWSGRPAWHIGPVPLSPVWPVAALLVVLIGARRLGWGPIPLAAWHEFLLGIGATLVVVAWVDVRAFGGPSELAGVFVSVCGEEIVYRVAVVVLVGAFAARCCGRDWRDTATWGSGPALIGLVGGAVVFTALPGHVAQMGGVPSAVAFGALGLVLGYVALRTGSIVAGVSVHLLLDLAALAARRGELSNGGRVLLASTALAGLVTAAMVAGRRLGLRRLMPAVIDLRPGAVGAIDVREPVPVRGPNRQSPPGSRSIRAS